MSNFLKFSLFVLVSLYSISIVAQNTPTPRISIQGTLLDARGAAVADGEHAVQFRLYDAAEGGNLIWTEDAVIESGGGIYSHYLGSSNPLDDSYFEQSLFVTLEIGSYELPRAELNYAPYTFTSNTAIYAQQVVCSGAVGDVKFSILNPSQFAEENGDCWVPMDGASMFGSELASVLGGTTLPNASGVFIRGHEYNDGQDPDRTPESPIAAFQDQELLSHTHTNSVSTKAGHSHSGYDTWWGGYSGDKCNGSDGGLVTWNRETSSQPDHTHTMTLASIGGSETRPVNLNLYAYIRID